ncbi:MAG: nucleotide exchange factor GrpE [Leptonema illini]|uniref:Protein GrpE n=2 Tax=Leptonema illini TaxID=183 RepID=H2CHF5_9LEPT|nr:nucleotide exchange factor GrpE [Leptonema illini]EHQ04778.1 Protein grpE [Leptonema illini DSM 21528]KAB2929384.1 MAG: nucleotide exchange factor GrpE [Leptonema illini]
MHPEQEKEQGIEETLEGIEQAQGRPEDDAAEEQGAAEAEGSNEAPLDPIEALKAELEETKQNWARERADFSNYRKRMIEEMGKARTSAVSNFVRSLIPVVDNLDLVLAAPTEDPAVKNFVIGVDMIRGEFLNILGREGIRPEVDAGNDFDPYLMEAVELEEREGFEGEKVEHVYKKAYVQISDGGERQVLRPATVKVIRGKRKDAEQEAKNEEGNAN